MASRTIDMVSLLAVAAIGCGRGGPVYPAGPLARPILGIDEAAADAQNRAALPAGFPGPQETACAADTTRAFIGELADHPVADAQVLFHWAPVLPGPLLGKGPVQQPELATAGQIVNINHSTLDTSFDHPFGFDFNADIAVDEPFQFLVQNRDVQNRELHAELEMGLLPETTFGFVPQAGDRVLLRGAWILDCGHPPYETELHPPGFLAFGRAQDAKTTIALALAVPWRVTQLFGPVGAVSDFADPHRLRDRGLPFPTAFYKEVLTAASTNKDHLEAHALLEALRFESIRFSVCAPSPRPANAVLRFSHRFTLRTGVTLQPTPHEESGCVDYQAAMGTSYEPAEPLREDHLWPWAEISQQASDQSGATLDVRQLVLDSLRSAGFNSDVPALHEDHPPVIDRYNALPLRPDAAHDSPTAIIAGADDQPYPFAGRARVWWE